MIYTYFHGVGILEGGGAAMHDKPSLRSCHSTCQNVHARIYIYNYINRTKAYQLSAISYQLLAISYQYKWRNITDKNITNAVENLKRNITSYQKNKERISEWINE